MIDETILARGGTRIVPLEKCDVADGNVVDVFDTWRDATLWPALTSVSKEELEKQQEQPRTVIEIASGERNSTVRREMTQATVVETRRLTKGEPEKGHISFQLPMGTTYRAGDYFGVLPLNPPSNIERVLKRFNIPLRTAIKLGSSTMSAIPTDVWIAAHDILQGYVELSQPASKKVTTSHHTSEIKPNMFRISRFYVI